MTETTKKNLNIKFLSVYRLTVQDNLITEKEK